MTSRKPTPPDSIPTYVEEGIERQDAKTLADIASWADELAAWKRRELDTEEIRDAASPDETIEHVETEQSGTIVEKRVPCGKNCSGCPHGPYRYRVERDGDSLEWEYLGAV